jgi:hypothetical protein
LQNKLIAAETNSANAGANLSRTHDIGQKLDNYGRAKDQAYDDSIGNTNRIAGTAGKILGPIATGAGIGFGLGRNIGRNSNSASEAARRSSYSREFRRRADEAINRAVKNNNPKDW